MAVPPATPVPTQSTPQFSMARAMLWMVIIAILLAAFINGGSTGTIKAAFGNLPPDDQELRSWYARKHGNSSIIIEREGSELRVVERRRFGFQFISPPVPPWTELGYSQPQRVSTSHEFSFLRFPVHLVVIALAAVLADSWLKRREKSKRQRSEILVS